MRELGERLGAYGGSAAALALSDWAAALDALLALGRKRETVIILDEYPYLLEHTPELDVVVAAGDSVVPAQRTVRAIGECKAGERITPPHLHRLYGGG